MSLLRNFNNVILINFNNDNLDEQPYYLTGITSLCRPNCFSGSNVSRYTTYIMI